MVRGRGRSRRPGRHALLLQGAGPRPDGRGLAARLARRGRPRRRRPGPRASARSAPGRGHRASPSRASSWRAARSCAGAPVQRQAILLTLLAAFGFGAVMALIAEASTTVTGLFLALFVQRVTNVAVGRRGPVRLRAARRRRRCPRAACRLWASLPGARVRRPRRRRGQRHVRGGRPARPGHRGRRARLALPGGDGAGRARLPRRAAARRSRRRARASHWSARCCWRRADGASPGARTRLGGRRGRGRSGRRRPQPSASSSSSGEREQLLRGDTVRDRHRRRACAAAAASRPPASQRRTTRAGAPATTAWSGTSPRTTAPAATTTFRPIRAPGRITAPVPIQQPGPISTGSIRGHCLPMGSCGSS